MSSAIVQHRIVQAVRRMHIVQPQTVLPDSKVALSRWIFLAVCVCFCTCVSLARPRVPAQISSVWLYSTSRHHTSIWKYQMWPLSPFIDCGLSFGARASTTFYVSQLAVVNAVMSTFQCSFCRFSYMKLVSHVFFALIFLCYYGNSLSEVNIK